MGTKKFFNLLLLTVLTLSTAGEAVEVPPQAKAILGLLGAGVANFMADKAQQNPMVSKFADKVGVDPKDIGNVIGMSAVSKSISYFVKPEIGKEFDKLSGRAPLAAAVSYLVSRRQARLVFQHIPALGRYLVCPKFNSLDPEKGCQGRCKDCSLTSGVICIAAYTAISKIIDGAG